MRSRRRVGDTIVRGVTHGIIVCILHYPSCYYVMWQDGSVEVFYL